MFKIICRNNLDEVIMRFSHFLVIICKRKETMYFKLEFQYVAYTVVLYSLIYLI